MSLSSTVKKEKTYQYITTWDHLHQALSHLRQYVEEDPKAKLALDVETYWLLPPPKPKTKKDGTVEYPVPRPIRVNGMLEGTVRTIQIGLPPEVEDLQYIIDVKALERSIEDRKKLGDLLRPILTKAIIYGANLKYEYQFIWALFKIRIPAANLRDVQLINGVLNAGNKAMRNGLDALYDNYLNPHFFKSYTGMFQGDYKLHKKKMQTSDWKAEVLTEDQLQYAADDASILIFNLYDAMVENHETRSIDSFVTRFEGNNSAGQTVTKPIKLEWKLIPIFAMMELRGMQYDLDYHNNHVIPFFTRKMEEAWEVLDQYIPKRKVAKNNGKRKKELRVEWFEEERININSWQQGIPAFATLGIDLPNYKEDDLEELSEELDHPALNALMMYRKAKSLLSKYGEAIASRTSSDGRVRANWRQLGGDQGIDTGRSSATDPALMTVPARDNLWGTKSSELFRKSFTCRVGYYLVDADYSQIEPRVMAVVCNDKLLQEVYDGESEIDRHSLTAKFMFNLDYFPGDDDPYRAAGKEYNLGSTYGMGIAKSMHKISRATKGAVTFASVDDFKAKRDQMFAQLKGVKQFTDEINKFVKAKAERYGTLKPFLNDDNPIAVVFTVYGRPRRWILSQMLNKAQMEAARANPEILSKDYGPKEERWKNIYHSILSSIGRQAFNFVAGQGTAADIFKLACIYVQEELDNQGFDFETEGIILVMHDEILLEVKEENLDKAKNILDTCMKRAAYEIISGVHIKVNIGSGVNWSNAH